MFLPEHQAWNFPGGPVVNNLPSEAGDLGSIPGWGTKIPHATGQVGLHAASCSEEPECHSEDPEEPKKKKKKKALGLKFMSPGNINDHQSSNYFNLSKAIIFMKSEV